MGIMPILPIVVLALSGTLASAGWPFKGRNVRNEGNLEHVTDAETINIDWRSLQAEAPSPTTTMCTDDTEGILNNSGEVCCPLECDGQCGGPGCGSFGAEAGLGSESCCESGITESGVMCGVGQEAPCI
ncbi:unnamed protein product, partial [Ectocarpus fasciculatus]